MSVRTVSMTLSEVECERLANHLAAGAARGDELVELKQKLSEFLGECAYLAGVDQPANIQIEGTIA